MSSYDVFSAPMKVMQIMRKPNGVFFSIEQLFETIRIELSADIDIEAYVNPYPSHGVWRRLLGMFRVIWHQGDVNHITGDVHFLSILLRRRKTILTIHDCRTLERLEGLKYQIFRLFWYWLPAKRSVAITVISESAKEELLRHLGEGDWPISVIPNLLSTEFEFSSKQFNDACPTILQVGTTTNKNIERVAAALQGLSCKLVIIGKLMPDQIAALQENEIVYENHFGISKEAVIDHYHECDIVIFASLYEGFGLPILEGQAVGRPVITSNLSSMPEAAGDGACLVDPFDVASIRKGVQKVLDDANYRELLVKNGFENVKRFDGSAISQQYADLYRAIAALPA